MYCEECGTPIWPAGAIVPAGTYVRIDDASHRVVTLDHPGPLPAMFDGRIALYRAAPAICGCVTPASATEALDARSLPEEQDIISQPA